MEALHETRLRFNKKLTKCLNHRITNESLLEIFYRSLNNNNKAVVDTVVGGALMSHSWEEATTILDRVTKTNRAWHTREAEVAAATYAIGMTAEHHRKEEERDQELAHMKNSIDLLTKHIIGFEVQKVNAVGAQGQELGFEH